MAVFPRRLGVAGAVLALALSARAQPPNQPAPLLTADEAVRLAIAGNPVLRAATRDVASAASGERSARSLANPEISFTPGLTAGGSDEELLLRQPLEVNGTRAARGRIAAARVRGARAGAVVTLRDLVFQTETAYYELARARALRSLAEDVLKTAEEFDRITTRQVEVGSRPGIDRTQTGIEAARARRDLVRAESEAAAAEAALNTLMGRSPDAPVGPLSPLTAATETLDSEGLLRQALAARAGIAAAAAERDAFRQEAALARAEGRPDIVPQFRAGSVTRGVSEAGFGIGISLPLLDYGSRRNRIRQAEEAARAQEDRIAAQRNLVRRDVEQAVTRLRAADAVLKDYSEGALDDARRLLEASRVGFQAGQTSVIALLEAQRTYRAVQAEYTDALVERALAASALRRAAATVPAEWLPTADEVRRNP